MIILDTNVISELMRSAPEPAAVAWVDAQPTADLHLTSMTVGELWFGAARLPTGRRRGELTASLTALLEEEFAGRVVPFDAIAAAHFGDICATRSGAGRPISVADAQIAAICRSYGATLATRNVRDFAGTGVDLIDPWLP